MVHKHLASILFLVYANSGYAAETIPLMDFLSRASESGLRVIYSSDLIPRRFEVSIDSEEAITVEQIRRVLSPFNLLLQPINDSSYTVVRVEQPDIPVVSAVPETRVGSDAPQLVEPNIEEIVVSTSLLRLFVNQDASKFTLGHSDLIERPATGNDPIRLVNQLPGSASMGLSARPYVRGGNVSETGIYYDGIRLYNPFHFNNYNALFGSFDSRIVDSLDFHSGGFSAKNGDSLSAAMIINTMDAAELGDTRELGLGLFNFSYLQSRTMNDQDWLINVRHSTVELVSGLVEADLGKPRFADLFGRYGWNLNNGDRITLNLFWIGDDMELQNASATEISNDLYSNTYLWLNSENSLTNTLSATSIVGISAIKSDRNGVLNKTGIAAGNLSDSRRFKVYNLKQDFNYTPNDSWSAAFGWDYKYLNAEYDYFSNLAIEPIFQPISNYTRAETIDASINESGQQFSAYASLKWAVNDRLITETGIRYDGHRYGNLNEPDQFDPRLSLRYSLTDSTVLRLGWGRYSQAEGIQELKVSDGLIDFQPIQKSSHLILGVDQEIWADFNLRIEAYRNRGRVTNVYFQNLANTLSLVPELQADRFQVAPEDFESQGLEASISGRWQSLNLWANYSYSSAKDKIDNVQIRRSWDQTHSGNLGVSTTIGEWQVALTGSSHKGWLTTPMKLDGGQISIGGRNGIRFDRYISWDVKMMRSWNIGGDVLRLEAGVTNLLNRENQISVDYELENGQLVESRRAGLPIAPFVDLFWRF